MDEMIINESDITIGSAAEKIQNKKIRTIADALLGGRVLLMPASTIYGISCCYDNAAALGRIYDIKKRKTDMPFIVLISDMAQFDFLVKDISKAAKKLIARYWMIKDPRPLTLIFKKDVNCGNSASSLPTIAIRMAGLKVMRNIIGLSGPIVSTSATISGTNLSPKDLSEVPPAIYENVDMAIRFKGALHGTESTIVDTTGNTPVLIREGAISFQSIMQSSP